jgi:hypothetical protein
MSHVRRRVKKKSKRTAAPTVSVFVTKFAIAAAAAAAEEAAAAVRATTASAMAAENVPAVPAARRGRGGVVGSVGVVVVVVARAADGVKMENGKKNLVPAAARAAVQAAITNHPAHRSRIVQSPAQLQLQRPPLAHPALWSTQKALTKANPSTSCREVRRSCRDAPRLSATARAYAKTAVDVETKRAVQAAKEKKAKVAVAAKRRARAAVAARRARKAMERAAEAAKRSAANGLKGTTSAKLFLLDSDPGCGILSTYFFNQFSSLV